MNEWYDSAEGLDDLALDYRIKSVQSAILKYKRYYPDHQARKVFDDLLGFRSLCDNYEEVLQLKKIDKFRIADMTNGKANDDGYRGIHVYFQLDGKHYPIEIQYNTYYDRQFNKSLHKYVYNKDIKILEVSIMKKKIAMVILATCLFGTLAGCEKDSSNKPEVPSTENSTNSVNQTENSTEKSEGISALSNANLVGTVIDFTETGCTLGKGSVTEDTMTAPATGEDTEGVEKISVQYADNTQFQISNSTSTNVTLEAGTKEDVKKSSAVFLYGEYQEDGTFLATRVIIDRFQK